jgi:hypothetical protein
LADVCAAVTEKSPCISWVHTFYRLICNWKATIQIQEECQSTMMSRGGPRR